MEETIRNKEVRGLAITLFVLVPFLVVQLYLIYFEYIPTVVSPYAATLPEELYMPIDDALKNVLSWMLIWPITFLAAVTTRLLLLRRHD